MREPPTSSQDTTVNIAVSVSDGTDPIQGATVTITNEDEDSFTGTTGSSGGCNLRNVTPGTYDVVVIKEGYNEYTDSLNVTEETSTLTITLTEE